MMFGWVVMKLCMFENKTLRSSEGERMIYCFANLRVFYKPPIAPCKTICLLFCSTVSPTTGHTTWLNQRVMQYTGRPLTEMLGLGWVSCLHSEDQDFCLST